MGRGQVRQTESKLRVQQEREAYKFVNILDDDYAIIFEAIQSENPVYNLPKAAEKKKKITKSFIAEYPKKKVTKRS